MSRKIVGLSLNDLLIRFPLKALVGNEEMFAKHLIYQPGLANPGLEMSGFFYKHHNEERRIMIFNEKIAKHIKTLDKKTKLERYNKIMSDVRPCLILTKSFEDPDLVLAAEKKSFPVLKYDGLTNEIISNLGYYVSRYLTNYDVYHASLVVVFGKGLLITGNSGIGKTEATLELIRKNHLFVCDDGVEIGSIGNQIIGRSSAIVKDFVEVRGIGILNARKMFGVEALVESAHIDLVCELVSYDKYQTLSLNRLREKREFTKIAGVGLPIYHIPVITGRKISELLEAAVVDHKLLEEGYDSNLDFIKKQKKILKAGSNE